MKLDIHVLLILAALIQVSLFFSNANASRLSVEENTCQVYTEKNADICDPDGDLANGDYDAAE